ncbi:D-alanyl-D-alanine carboxypeptidase [Bacillus taeanensis]|uniref:serine-type D-Ala-D-Ala carboxypeptidase n=2 Tax=Bacillus taeanensis TaxID=273032 RepID=A0A366XWY2_9BACI|nr:D-alanyl-D-alanine carboxypeptidase family protein [Bacillus taeanensis]RBW70407.1 D-alanyl-D-alanine carboxypeptidase [Bacillus taeanensis]
MFMLSFFSFSIPINVQAANLSVSGQSAILMEQESGRVLFEKDAHTTRRIASITKVMTAILAIESGKMKEKVKITDSMVRVEGSSIYLKEGESLTLEDLVYGLMLRSGNDAAVAIAEYVGGSLDGFVYLMNQKAQEIGMKNTEFANPHGLDDHENHYSTAYDMALLTRYAMGNENFQKISAAEKYSAPQEGESWNRSWSNKNKMLRLYKYSTGGKTGYTKRAKRTLISTASKDGFNLIAVTLNAPDDWNDHIGMFEWGFNNYKLKSLVEEGKITGIKDPFYKGKVYAARSLSYPLTEDEIDQIRSSLTLYNPPKGNEWSENGIPRPVGKMFFQLTDQTIGEVPLFYEGDPEVKKKKGFWGFFKELFLILNGVSSYD